MTEDKFENKECSNDTKINRNKIQAWFDQHCFDKANCLFSFPEAQTKQPAAQQFLTADIKGQPCGGATSRFFIQHTCTVNDADQEAKYNKVSLVTACILLIAFCFINLIYYMQATSKLDQLAYDANTITAGDFTVELDVNRQQYEEL